jgi:hypothetical protein
MPQRNILSLRDYTTGVRHKVPCLLMSRIGKDMEGSGESEKGDVISALN